MTMQHDGACSDSFSYSFLRCGWWCAKTCQCEGAICCPVLSWSCKWPMLHRHCSIRIRWQLAGKWSSASASILDIFLHILKHHRAVLCDAVCITRSSGHTCNVVTSRADQIRMTNQRWEVAEQGGIRVLTIQPVDVIIAAFRKKREWWVRAAGIDADPSGASWVRRRLVQLVATVVVVGHYTMITTSKTVGGEQC